MTVTDVADLERRRVADELEAYYSGSVPPALLDPHIASLTPATVSAAAGATVVTVRGSRFAADSVVEINQAGQATTYVDAGTLTVSYDPTVAGTLMFTVRNPAGEQESNSVPFVVGALAGQLEAVEPEPEGEAPAPSAGNGGTRKRKRTGEAVE